MLFVYVDVMWMMLIFLEVFVNLLFVCLVIGFYFGGSGLNVCVFY